MSLSKTLYSLLSNGSTHEDLIEGNVDWDAKDQIKQTNSYTSPIKINNIYITMCERGHEI